MSDKEKMLKELRGLWKRDPGLFNEIIQSYAERGDVIFPRDKNKKTYRQKKVKDWVWASVEFLKWRDGINTRNACEKLAMLGMDFKLFDCPDGRWQRIPPTPMPEIFSYSAEGEKGKADGENIRQTYYAAKSQDDMDMATLLLDQMQAAHKGEFSMIKKKNLPPV